MQRTPPRTARTITIPIHPWSWTRRCSEGSKEGNEKNFIEKKHLSPTVALHEIYDDFLLTNSGAFVSNDRTRIEEILLVQNQRIVVVEFLSSSSRTKNKRRPAF